MAESRRYWHGGAPGRHVGDLLLPPDETGVTPVAAFCPEGLDASHVRTDRVFLGSDRSIAQLFAAMHPSGAGVVYEVEPAGEVEPDPDYLEEPCLSWQVSRALVISVHPLPETEIARIRWAVGFAEECDG